MHGPERLESVISHSPQKKETTMKKMLAFELISYGFRPTFNLPDDQRLTVEGKDFNDFSYGAGWSKKKAIQSPSSSSKSTVSRPPRN